MTKRRNFLGRTNEGFTCHRCGLEVLPLVRGGFRNHCPRCLWSKHVDRVPGDRSAACGGAMAPIGVERDAKREWMIVHRCLACGFVRRNRAALADPRQPDDLDALIDLARQAAGGPSEG